MTIWLGSNNSKEGKIYITEHYVIVYLISLKADLEKTRSAYESLMITNQEL